MNDVQLLGRIGNDLEIKKIGEIEVLNFNLAVARATKKNETDWIPCTAFGKTAEALVKYSGRGKRILVDGSIRVENYNDKDGNKKTSTKVIINRVNIIDFINADTKGNPFVEGASEDDQLPF